jgi:hypothetical protein
MKTDTFLTLTSRDFLGFTRNQMQFIDDSVCVKIEQMEQPENCTFGTVNFNRACFEKVRLIRNTLDCMPKGAWLLYADADVIFCKPIGEIIARAKKIHAETGAQIVAQEDPDTGICAGFMAIRASLATDAIFQMVEGHRTDAYNDQIALNAIIRANPNAAKIAAYFPRDYISSHGNLIGGLWRGGKVQLPKDCAAFHLNYCIGLGQKQALAQSLVPAY